MPLLKLSLENYDLRGIREVKIFPNGKMEFTAGEPEIGLVDDISYWELKTHPPSVTFNRMGWHVEGGKEITKEEFELLSQKERFIASLDSLSATYLGWLDEWHNK